MDALDRLLRAGLRGIRRKGLFLGVFSVTISTAPLTPVFGDVAFGLECVRLLRAVCRTTETRLHAYCLMPDHACLLLAAGRRETLATTVNAWKSACRHARRRLGAPEEFWQRGYADRLLPSPEALRTATRYVLEKPVRAGLVADAREYPLCGPTEARG